MIILTVTVCSRAVFVVIY